MKFGWQGWLRYAFTILLAVLTIHLLALWLSPVARPNLEDWLSGRQSVGSNEVERWSLGDWGHGARSENWEVYFTVPSGESDRDLYQGGLDSALVKAIGMAEESIDIAAYDFGHEPLMHALFAAQGRGVKVRMVADDDNREEFEPLEAAIPIRFDERSALMHNKFVIVDEREVWTGSLNYTENGFYRNNNHTIRLWQPALVRAYHAEFEEMFGGDFGPRSDADNLAEWEQGNLTYSLRFVPEFDVRPQLLAALQGAKKSIRFLAFSLTLDELGDLLIHQEAAGLDVQGIFDARLARGLGSEYPRLYCAGLSVFLDGNPFALHHKIFIIDEDSVLTGSLNFSQSGTVVNDENWLFLEDAALAAEFLKEYERNMERAYRPNQEDCV